MSKAVYQSESVHHKAKQKPRDWRKKRRQARKIAAASRKRNRGK